jgi:hypothetical protein
MVYLSEKKVVHRDLAARNILVWAMPPSARWRVKLADFGRK